MQVPFPVVALDFQHVTTTDCHKKSQSEPFDYYRANDVNRTKLTKKNMT